VCIGCVCVGWVCVERGGVCKVDKKFDVHVPFSNEVRRCNTLIGPSIWSWSSSPMSDECGLLIG